MGNNGIALLVADVQAGAVATYAQHPDIVERLREAIDAAHASKVLVIYSVLRFRHGHPEAHPRNRVASGIAAADILTAADPQAQIHDALTPACDDVVVTKQRVGAFSGSDLEMVLRGSQIHSLVLSGIATSGVVLATFLQALDLDYDVTVLSDACSDRDISLHDTLVDTVFTRATVRTVSQWRDSLRESQQRDGLGH